MTDAPFAHWLGDDAPHATDLGNGIVTVKEPSPWQPIETLPRVGRFILACRFDGDIEWWHRVAIFRENDPEYRRELRLNHAIFWMPIPPWPEFP